MIDVDNVLNNNDLMIKSRLETIKKLKEEIKHYEDLTSALTSLSPNTKAILNKLQEYSSYNTNSLDFISSLDNIVRNLEFKSKLEEIVNE